tara:strand:+ start:604 stop:1317 length:714 start_codon:yes stop_codon:yes gene_type:complete
MHILPKSAREFVLYQRTKLLPKRRFSKFYRLLILLGLKQDDCKSYIKSVADDDSQGIDEKYFLEMKNLAYSLVSHVPTSVSTILDIGCGIAGLDIFLDKLLSPSKIFLLDKTKTEDKIWYNFLSKGAFYNSLELAKETLVLNGVSSSKINLIEASGNSDINLDANSIDLIISTISWGFHYPINLYIKSVFNILKDNGRLIVDIRKYSGGVEELEKLFDVEIIFDTGKLQTVKCRKKI